MKPIVIERLNHTVNLDMEKLVKQDMTISYSEQEGGRESVLLEKFQKDKKKMFWLREELRGESKMKVREDKAKIEALLSIVEFLALLEVRRSMSNGLNHVVNLSTGIVIQQEVTESCSKQEVSHIPEVRERKAEDKIFGKTMLPEKQESDQERILQEKTHSL